MCGILSIISENEPNLDKDVFNRALEKSKHRGPDGSRVEKKSENCLFGFNWLSIQDLRAEAMQPFHYKGNWLVFNGEIYNFIELREELEKEGWIKVSSESDYGEEKYDKKQHYYYYMYDKEHVKLTDRQKDNLKYLNLPIFDYI